VAHDKLDAASELTTPTLVQMKILQEFPMVEVPHPDTPRARGDYEAPHLTPATPAEDVRTIMINQVSLGAVFAGVVVALVTQLILNMLGIGLGAATLSPVTGDSPTASAFSIGAGIWWMIAGILAALAGGYTAGRRPAEGIDGSLAWAHELGADHAVDLLSPDFDGRQHLRGRLQHDGKRTR
jgi:hypothetical protein